MWAQGMDAANNRLHLFAEAPLKKYARNVHSQHGEDGILTEVLARIGALGRGAWAFECGARDGKRLSNTYYFASRHAFNVVAVERNSERFEQLLATRDEPCAGKIIPVNRWLSPTSDTIGEILRHHGAPRDLALMSIDVNGCGYQAWENLTDDFRPMVVVIEVNSRLPPGAVGVPGDRAGATFTSMLELGTRKGYALVAHTGNMIFVRNDLVPRLGLPGVTFRDPNRLFDWRWVERA